MIIFTAIGMVMLVSALWLLLWPLLTPSTRTIIPRHELNVRIAQQRLAEITIELENQQLSDADFNTAQTDLEDSLLTDIQSEERSESLKKSGPLAVLIVATLFPIAVIALYLILGSPNYLSTEGQPVTTDTSARSPDALLAKLKLRLEQNPTDREGWAILANAMMSLGEYAQAVGAYEKLYALTGDDAEVLVGYADALAMLEGGTLNGRVTALLDRALKIDPEQPQALWLAGMAAEARGDLPGALEHWHRLKPALHADPQAQSELQALIDRVTELAISRGLAVANHPQTIQRLNRPAAPVTLTVRIEIAPDLATQIESSHTLYVYARSNAGDRIPVAAVRRSAGELPLELVLDDRSSLMGTSVLSDYNTVILGAHISRTGDAIRQPGDLVSESIPVDLTTADTVTLMIRQAD
ncbi:MAG: c-type cytochrome biogenesis protein CcmI [Arenicellales bacterium]|jgi:cytochrome c-type biogenesis protein CcmH|nr:c-type cytochrome biogenesis protein CcmI [Arenicellales bacterium]